MSETPETTPDDYQSQIDDMQKQIDDLREQLAAAEQERDNIAAKSKEKTDTAGKLVAALMAERDEWKQRAEYKPDEAAMKAQLETTLAQVNSANTTIRMITNERDTLRQKNNHLHKELDSLKAMHKRLGDGVQQVFGASSRPVSGPCQLVITWKPVNGMSEVTFDIPAGHSLFNTDIVADRHYVYMTRAAAAELPVPDVPEQEVVDDLGKFKEAA